MNKTLPKAFMQRAKLKNRYNRNPTELNHLHLKKQRDYCANLLNRVKKEYYTNLDLSIFKDNKTFWKNIRPLFSDKQKVRERNIILIEDETVISENSAVAEKLNNYFIDVIENLEIEHYNEIMDNEHIGSNNGRKEIETIITKYKNHPSILKIKEHIKVTEKITFSKPTPNDLDVHLITLDPKKTAVENDIPTKILIDTKEIANGFLTNIYHKCIDNQTFPLSLKKADVIPSHKQLEKTSVKNYRPISLLPCISKLYERDMYNQIKCYMENYLSPYLFGIRKAHSTEQCLNTMLENWKKALDCNKKSWSCTHRLIKSFRLLKL